MSPQLSSLVVAPSARTSSRTLLRAVGLGAAAASVALVVTGLPRAAQAATPATTPATIPATTTFTFSGTVSGTLHMADGTCGGTGGQFVFDGKELEGSKAKTWTVNVNSPSTDGGTWKKFTSEPNGATGVSVVLQSRTASKTYDWITKSGKITTSSTGGSINVALGPDHSLSGAPGSGTIHLSGSWGCKAG